MTSTMDEIRRRLREERRGRDRALGAYTAAREAEKRAQRRLDKAREAVRQSRDEAKRQGVPASDLALADEVVEARPARTVGKEMQENHDAATLPAPQAPGGNVVSGGVR